MASPAMDLSHLQPSAQEVAGRSDEERLHRVRGERWIGYPRASEAVGRLKALADSPRRQRMPNLLLVGPTNNGKSMIIEKFRRDVERADVRVPSPGSVGPRVVVMQMPAEPSAARFYATLLEASDSPERPGVRTRPSAADMERTATWWLSGCGVRVLVIDELHNLLSGNAARRREFLNLLRYLGNRLRIPIVGVGTHDAYLAIRSDDQLENRFEPFALPRWRPDDQALSLLASFATSFPLRRPSPIATPEMASYLLDRTEGTIGELSTLLSAAATVAITDGEESINAATLAAADYRGPTVRRRTFERALK